MIDLSKNNIFVLGEKETNIKSMLASEDFPKSVLIRLTDIIWPAELEQYEYIITDNFYIDPCEKIYKISPEYWGEIYNTEFTFVDKTPTKKINCLMNRIDGQRLLLFYKLHEYNLVKNNHISFNCQPSFDSFDADYSRKESIKDRRAEFKQIHDACGWNEYDHIYEYYKDKIPILLLPNDPIYAALDSEITVISETYVCDYAIAFSEKIFRSLLLPRPWLLNCSPGSVKLLRECGFDVMDDVVNHDHYDHLYDKRIDAMLELVLDIKFNADRCNEAVLHNKQVLNNLKQKFNKKYQTIVNDIHIKIQD